MVSNHFDHEFDSVTLQEKGKLLRMTNHRKMVSYNPAGIRMNQYALIEHLRVQVQRRRRRERRLSVKPPPPKIVFVVVKQEGVTYVERLEHNVEDGIDRLVCFDARYVDPNLRYNVVTKT